jgi:hypothetical protein
MPAAAGASPIASARALAAANRNARIASSKVRCDQLSTDDGIQIVVIGDFFFERHFNNFLLSYNIPAADFRRHRRQIAKSDGEQPLHQFWRPGLGVSHSLAPDAKAIFTCYAGHRARARASIA